MSTEATRLEDEREREKAVRERDRERRGEERDDSDDTDSPRELKRKLQLLKEEQARNKKRLQELEQAVQNKDEEIYVLRGENLEKKREFFFTQRVQQKNKVEDIDSLLAFIDSLRFEELVGDIKQCAETYHSPHRKNSNLTFIQEKKAALSSFPGSRKDDVVEISEFRRANMSATLQTQTFSLSRVELNDEEVRKKLAASFFSNHPDELDVFIEKQVDILEKLRRAFLYADDNNITIDERTELQPVVVHFLKGFMSDLARFSPAIADNYRLVTPINDVKLSFKLNDVEKKKEFTVSGSSDIFISSTDDLRNILAPSTKSIACELKIPFSYLYQGKSFVEQKDQLLAQLTALATISQTDFSIGMLTDLFSLSVMLCRKNSPGSLAAKFSVQLIATVVQAEEYILNLLVMLYLSLGGDIDGIVSKIQEGSSAVENEGEVPQQAPMEPYIASATGGATAADAAIQSALGEASGNQRKSSQPPQVENINLRFDSTDEELRDQFARKMEEMRRWRSRYVLKEDVYLGETELEQRSHYLSPMEKFLSAR